MPVTGIETKIVEAFLDRMSSLPFSPVMPMQAPNVNYNPTTGTGFLKASILPRTTEPLTLNPAGDNDYGGIFQVDVFWPIGKGVTDPFERASVIAVHFKRGTNLYRGGIAIEINRPPTVERPLQETAWYQVPVSIRYRAFIPNP